MLYRTRPSPKAFARALRVALLAPVGLVPLTGSACGEDASRTSGSATVAQSGPSVGGSTSAVGSGAASALPGPSGDSLAPNPVPAHVGRYEGDYESKKGDIALAPGVRVTDWKRDDGTSASGLGKLRIDISADGQVSGSIDGPLGPGLIRGVYSEDLLSATLSPTDPTQIDAFDGTLSGTLEGDSLRVQLAAATADARIARRADAKLTRTP